MPPKRALKKTAEAALLLEDPHVEVYMRKSAKWNERTTATYKRQAQVQLILASLARQTEECNRELNIVYTNAHLLSSLRIGEYRQRTNPLPPVAPVKKTRGKRDGAAKGASRSQVDENSTEALIAAMDERKRIKVSTALVNHFKLSNAEYSPSGAQSGTLGGTHNSSNSNPVTPPAVGVSQSALHMFSVSATRTSADTMHSFHSGLPVQFDSAGPGAEQHRRPRDVPQELWDEICKLRLQRISLEERSIELMRAMEINLARFDRLMQMQGINSYTIEALGHALELIKQKA
ncbi:hypothetical protein ERJ75_000722600 [Trypanosoma vivax]|nr:hypothetical protein TRVL_10359 [Trypanosoma vivax]KAH8613702.1 hypothetical protein ERJ75_000722600 [Trypanosoma vivax]